MNNIPFYNTIPPSLYGTKVFVYWNIHKSCWSIKHKNKVIAHTQNLTLSNCTFKVSEKGRQRVIKENKKNVHAGVQGYLFSFININSNNIIYYNPYTQPTFTINNIPIYTADIVSFYPNKLVKNFSPI